MIRPRDYLQGHHTEKNKKIRKFSIHVREYSGGKEEEDVTDCNSGSPRLIRVKDTICPLTLTPNSTIHLILIHGNTTNILYSNIP